MPEDDPTTDPGPPGEGTSTVRADPAQLRPGQHIGHILYSISILIEHGRDPI